MLISTVELTPIISKTIALIIILKYEGKCLKLLRGNNHSLPIINFVIK